MTWDILALQPEEHGGERRELDVQAAIAVLPGNILRPDFAEVADVRTTEHFGICVEDFLPLAARGCAQAVIVADHWREVEHAQDLVPVVVFTDKRNNGVVGVVAPDPFETGVVVVDFPERCVFLVQVVQHLHHLQELSVTVPADQVPVE